MIHICTKKPNCPHQATCRVVSVKRSIDKSGTVRVACFECGRLIYKPVRGTSLRTLLFGVLLLFVTFIMIRLHDLPPSYPIDQQDFASSLPGRYQPDPKVCTNNLSKAGLIEIISYNEEKGTVEWKNRAFKKGAIQEGVFNPDDSLLNLSSFGQFKAVVDMPAVIYLQSINQNQPCTQYYKSN